MKTDYETFGFGIGKPKAEPSRKATANPKTKQNKTKRVGFVPQNKTHSQVGSTLKNVFLFCSFFLCGKPFSRRFERKRIWTKS